jgi:hypothetical protein
MREFLPPFFVQPAQDRPEETTFGMQGGQKDPDSIMCIPHFNNFHDSMDNTSIFMVL